MPGEVGAQGVPLGVATAVLELDISQIVKGQKQVEATIQNIVKAQQLLLRGDQALQASAKTTLGLLQQQQKATGGQRAAAVQKETQELRAQVTLSSTINRTEAERTNFARQTAQALEQQTRQMERQGAIAARLASGERVRAAAEAPGSFTGQLRQDAFGGGLPQATAGGRGGRNALGNPNIPTFAQFGLFPFAGLAGSLGAQGVQQGILGASSVLGIAELGAFEGSLTRLGKQLQNFGGIFGALATGGARAAQALGAQSGGLASALTSITFAAAPLAGAILLFAVLANAIEQFNQTVQKAADDILERAQRVAQGETSQDVRGGIQRTERERDFVQGQRDQLATAITQIEELVRTVPFRELEARVAPINQQISGITGGAITGGTGVGAFQVRALIGELDTTLTNIGVTIAKDTVLLNSEEIARNDAAAATDRLVQAQLDAIDSARELTNTQLQQKIDEWKNAIVLLVSIIQSNRNISSEYQQELVEQVQLLHANIAAYEGLKSPFRDFVLELQKIPAILKGTLDFFKNLRERSVEFERQAARQGEDEAIQDRRQQQDRDRQRLRALQDFGRETQQAEEQYQTQRGRVIEDAARADLELVAEAAERRQELIDDAAQKEIEAEEEHQSRIAKILRDGRTRILEAAARLDARGVLETQRRLRDQIAEENEKRQEAREEAQDKLADQLADLDENLEEQRRRRAEDLQRRLQEMAVEFAAVQQRRREDFVRRLQQEAQDQALQDQREAQDRALRRQRQLADFNRETSDQLQHYTNLAQIQQVGLSFLEQGYQNFLIDLARRTAMQSAQTQVAFAQGYQSPIFRAGAYASGIVQGTGTLFSGQGQFPTQFASGIGRVPNDMIASLHAGERVLTPLQNANYQRDQGSSTVIVNINGDLGNNSAPAIRDAAREGTIEGINAYMRQMAAQAMNRVSGGRAE